MKLSEMTAKEAAKTLVRITMPVKRIAGDEKFAAALKSIATAERTTLSIINALVDLIPVLLESHYSDIIQIAAAMTGKTVKQAEETPLGELVDEVRGSLDGEYLRFFRSSAARTMNQQSES